MSVLRSSSSSTQRIVFCAVIGIGHSCSLLCLIGICYRQVEGKQGPGGLVALHLNLTPMQVHDPLGEIQSNARARNARGRARTIEAVEDLGQLIRGNSNAPVAHRAECA